MRMAVSGQRWKAQRMSCSSLLRSGGSLGHYASPNTLSSRFRTKMGGCHCCGSTLQPYTLKPTCSKNLVIHGQDDTVRVVGLDEIHDSW